MNRRDEKYYVQSCKIRLRRYPYAACHGGHLYNVAKAMMITLAFKDGTPVPPDLLTSMRGHFVSLRLLDMSWLPTDDMSRFGGEYSNWREVAWRR